MRRPNASSEEQNVSSSQQINVDEFPRCESPHLDDLEEEFCKERTVNLDKDIDKINNELAAKEKELNLCNKSINKSIASFLLDRRFNKKFKDSYKNKKAELKNNTSLQIDTRLTLIKEIDVLSNKKLTQSVKFESAKNQLNHLMSKSCPSSFFSQPPEDKNKNTDKSSINLNLK